MQLRKLCTGLAVECVRELNKMKLDFINRQITDESRRGSFHLNFVTSRRRVKEWRRMDSQDIQDAFRDVTEAHRYAGHPMPGSEQWNVIQSLTLPPYAQTEWARETLGDIESRA